MYKTHKIAVDKHFSPDLYAAEQRDKLESNKTLSKLKFGDKSCANCPNRNKLTGWCKFYQKLVQVYNICINHGKKRI